MILVESVKKYNIEKELIELFKTLIIRKAGFDDHHVLTHKDFEYFCFIIEEKSKINLSVSTLRRIWKNEYDRIPQDSTLDALAQSIDYENWMAFKSDAIKNNSLKPESLSKKSFPKTRKRKSIYLYLSLFAIIIILATGVLIKQKRDNNLETINLENVVFKSYGTISTGVPNTVVFEYNIDDVDADSFFIQQSWNINDRYRIYKNNYFQTVLYYYPDYHVATLIANDKVIKEHEVYVNTEGWLPYVTYNNFNDHPIYLKVDSLRSNNTLSVSLPTLKKNQIDLDKNWVVHFRTTGTFKRIDSDNFTVKTRIKLKDEPFRSCPFFFLMVNCLHASFEFPLIKKGCENATWIKFSDFVIEGEHSDLSAVGCDLDIWHELVLKNVEKNVTLFLNDKKVYQHSYNRPGGVIAGFDLFFNCIGEIDYISLYDKENQLVYEDRFEE